MFRGMRWRETSSGLDQGHTASDLTLESFPSMTDGGQFPRKKKP